jgi:sec-independent protein translocase protein TatA
MGATSIWHWVIVALIVVLLFGRGKISEVMGDVAKGIKSFKKGMAEDPDEPQKVEKSHSEPVDVTPSEEKKDA